jgi:ribosome-binding protein aMBF1 (putative translation factor)
MPKTLASSAVSAHRVIPEIRPEMAHADLRKPDIRDFQAEIGRCLESARNEQGWTLEQLSAALHRDPRQVRRWIAGDERVQLDVVFAVPELREPFVVALAKLARMKVTTTIERAA